MVFYIIHPDQYVFEQLGIQECEHIKFIRADLADVNTEALKRGKFAVVAPGNSFGLMDGGYDLAIIRKFGQEVQDEIQDRIAAEWYGELPIGCATSCGDQIKFVYAPTMQIPMNIFGTDNVYKATLAAIKEASSLGCENVLLPSMGAGTGRVPFEHVGRQIFNAIEQSRRSLKREDLTWEYAQAQHEMYHEMTGQVDATDENQG